MPQRIGLQVRILTKLLERLDYKILSFSEKEDLKFTLLQMRKLLDKKIAKIEESLSLDD